MHNPLTITIVRNTLARHPARIFTHERARAALRDVDLLCRKATDAAQVLVMRVQRWERQNDLDPEADLTAACRRLVSPKVSARIRTEGEFLAEFSAAVAVVLAERRRREENAHHKRPDPESFSGFTEAQRVALGIATGLADSIGTRVGGNKRGQVQAEIEAQNKGKAEGQEARG
jgi:hypothetical protein